VSLPQPRIISIRITTGPARKQPKAGDMRYLKGRMVWQIREQRRVPSGMPHAGAGLVSNGRPLWKWVDRHSADDTQWAWTSRNAKKSDTDLREYMEQGCLCLIEGRIKIDPRETNRAAAARYLNQCTCSRHPDHGRKDL
jgi:hypothetical protein